MRGMPVGSNDPTLCANSSAAENGLIVGNWISPTATGFQITDNSPEVNYPSGDTYIYLAIRRPNKPPTSGTQVYNAIASTSSGSVGQSMSVGINYDMAIILGRSLGQRGVEDRLRAVALTNTNGAAKGLETSSTASEATNFPYLYAQQSNGTVLLGGNGSADSAGYSYHFFRRAVGVFDEVCYTGTNSSTVGSQTVTHQLGVVPELMIVKRRSSTGSWYVYSAPTGNTSQLRLNSASALDTGPLSGDYPWNSQTPSSTQFFLGGGGNYDNWNLNGSSYVAYLFASLPGIQYIGSFVGNGTSQTINCGFTTGARFILIKRTDSTGDWYVWDSARGILASNDPHLSLNTTAAEVITNDSVDPDATGFIVNQNSATNINVNGASYIFLSIA
jgi:hypothetical protein